MSLHCGFSLCPPKKTELFHEHTLRMCKWAGKHTLMCLKVKWLTYALVFKIICEGRGDGSEGEDGSLAAKTHNPSLTPNLWSPGPTWWRNIADSWVLSSACCTCVCPHPDPPQKINWLRGSWEFSCFMLVLTETSVHLFLALWFIVLGVGNIEYW